MFLTGSYWSVFFIHMSAVSTAYVLAWMVCNHGQALPLNFILLTLPVLVLLRWVAISRHKLANGLWLYTGFAEVKDLVWAVAAGSVFFSVVVRTLFQPSSIPVSVYLVEAGLTFVFSLAIGWNSRRYFRFKDARKAGEGTPIIIVGAGSAAVQLLLALKQTNYRAVGLVDDDAKKQRLRLVGVPVIGKIYELPTLALRYGALEILVAIPSATGTEMLRITDLCTQAGLPFQAVPSLSDLVDGRLKISEFHEIDLNELLGREPVQMDADYVRSQIRGRVVMVTGAAGSIGSELSKQLLRYQPAKLICVDQAETPLFHLQQHILASSTVEIVYSVANITRTERMRHMIREHEVKVIFHAAAYKHVPMTEMNPEEGLENNVFGLRDLVETAEECGCEDFLLISTDKAVNPSSLMGCTKRIGEMIVGSHPPGGMRCVSVRFGNVLGSQGSVIPLFQEQIRTRRQVTITHPEMTRYFMTIPEAVSLVLQAFTVGEHGSVLVLDMGLPIRILDLAKALIRISGNKEHEIEVIYTGMRPGEKLHEELFYKSELRAPTTVAKVTRASGFLPDRQALSERLQELQLFPHYQDSGVLRAKLKQIIPEYQWEQDRVVNAIESSSPTFRNPSEKPVICGVVGKVEVLQEFTVL